MLKLSLPYFSFSLFILFPTRKALLKGFPHFSFSFPCCESRPALFPPPHFGTLSKIQKGGEPVPQPGKEHHCHHHSVRKWNWYLGMSERVLCNVLCMYLSVQCVPLVNLLYILSQCLQHCLFVLCELGSTTIVSKWIIKKANKKSKKSGLALKTILSSCYVMKTSVVADCWSLASLQVYPPVTCPLSFWVLWHIKPMSIVLQNSMSFNKSIWLPIQGK